MLDLTEKALIYQEFAATKANAHYAMADYCRRNHMRLGVAATVVSTLVGSAVFAGMATRVGTSSGTLPEDLEAWGVMAYVAIAILSISAPVLTGLQTFLKYAEQAERHSSTAVGYDILRQRLDLFMLRLNGADGADRDAALNDLEDLISEFGRISQDSLTLPDKVYNASASKRRTPLAPHAHDASPPAAGDIQ
jgi:hypothetical protein